VEFKDVYSASSLALFQHESAAEVIFKYEPSVVPGLLQTEEYARALLSSLGVASDRIDRIWELRCRRQELLTQSSRPEITILIDESALSRPVGNLKVMHRQLEHINELAARPRIHLSIIPFRSGPHLGMGVAFTLLQFSAPELQDMLYLEDASRDSIIHEDEEVLMQYMKRFASLQEMSALPEFLGAELKRIERRLAEDAGVTDKPP
jgi:hypothetical protein